MEQARRPGVFLSYPGRRNEELYEVICEALSDLQVDEVIDWKDFPAGESIGQQIFSSIRAASVVVAVLNDDDNVFNHNVMIEFGYALALNRALVPVVEDRVRDRIPFNLLDIKAESYRDLARPEQRQAFREQIRGAVQRHIDRLMNSDESSPAGDEPGGWSVFRRLRERRDAAWRSVRGLRGLARPVADVSAQIDRRMERRQYEAAQELAEWLIRRLRLVEEVRGDWGFLLQRCVVGFAFLGPLAYLLLVGFDRLGLLRGTLAGASPQVFTAIIYALGPLLLAVPAARALARGGPLGLLAAGVCVVAFGAWGMLSYLFVGRGWPPAGQDFTAWLAANARPLLFGTTLGSLFSLSVLASLRDAVLHTGAALLSTLLLALTAAVVFLAANTALEYLVAPLLFGQAVTVDAARLQATLLAGSFGAALLGLFTFSTSLFLRAPWLLSTRFRNAEP